MFKHTQIIRREIADELLECVWPFCEIGAERVKAGDDVNLLCVYQNLYFLVSEIYSVYSNILNNISLQAFKKLEYSLF